MKTTNYLAGLAAITMTFTGVAAPISAYADDISKSASIDYATYGNFVYIIKADKTADIVEYNGKYHQEYIYRLSPGIENKTAKKKHRILQPSWYKII